MKSWTKMIKNKKFLKYRETKFYTVIKYWLIKNKKIIRGECKVILKLQARNQQKVNILIK